MELVPGLTLERVISRHGLGVKETLDYGIQIADWLSAAHAAGIVHRHAGHGFDLKSSSALDETKGKAQ